MLKSFQPLADSTRRGKYMSNGVSNLSLARIKKLEYVLLSGSEASGDLSRKHDQAYQLWKKNWQDTFAELKTEAKLKADDFTRQRVISALFSGETAVGLLLHTHFNLDLAAVRDHTYLATYPAHIIEELRAQGCSEVLSMEYLTLHENWRKHLVGVSMAEVILGLGAKVLEASNFSSMIVVTRNAKRVNQILYGYGARCLVPNLTKHNVSVDLVSLDHGKTHPGKDEEVNQLIEHFWRRRQDTVGIESLFQNPAAAAPQKKVA
jgi:hypothetical protein